ncbi:hypothetical protein [Vibrio cholerae]|uniref:hypothetical protein n=1 Tax=Vibrio cholerae TaxID=666 RepID=UPI0030199F1C|nr:hypothetical protein [Vibrio cholerae]
MEINDFLLEHASALIAVGGSLLGVLVGNLGKLIDNFHVSKSENRRFTRDYKSKYVIEPILKYLELDLKMAQIVFAQSQQDEKLDIDCKSQADIIYVSALASSINDELGGLLSEYNREKMLLNTYALSEKGEGKSVDKAYKSLKRLQSIAGQIIGKLGGYRTN